MSFDHGADRGDAVDPAVLPISEVSRRTGIPAVSLRSWETRYGLPAPERAPSGERRYRESDCVLLADVLRRRAAGQSLVAAFDQAATGREPPETSLFAGLRRRHPDVAIHVLDKNLLSALSRAIEDECCAKAQRPVLLGGFQREGFYEQARPRWRELARTAEQTVVLADFERSRRRPGPITEVALPGGSPLRREWLLVCDAADHPACVVGWERPGQDKTPDRGRIFETIWSVDPQVVRDGTRLGLGLADRIAPRAGVELSPRLNEATSRSSVDLDRASGLIGRTLDYLGRRRDL